LKQQFSVGDKTVYPVHGVAEVVALEQRDIGGSKIPVYILKILETGLKIIVPTTNAGSVGLRDLISSKQVKEVYSILKSRDIPRDTQTWNRRSREYMEKIKTGSVFEIAEVMRDLCVLRQTKELSFGERKMLDNARGLLIKELALAKGVGDDKIAGEIDAIFAPAAA
jgi:CarD family transcriptional regulator